MLQLFVTLVFYIAAKNSYKTKRRTLINVRLFYRSLKPD
jgi:hypothetical protein